MTVRYRKDAQKWMVDISLPGRPRLRRLLPTAKNKSQALQAERVIVQELFEGRYGTPSAPAFALFVQSVYLPYAQLNKRSWRSDVGHCHVLTRFFGQQPLDRISPADVERFKQKRLSEMSVRKKPLSPASVNRAMEVLSRIFSLAVRDGLVKRNPCQAVTKLKTPSRRYRILSPQEEQRLLAVLVGRRTWLFDLVLLALATGLRRGELLNLRWKNVNLTERVLTVINTKTGRDRFIPLTPIAQEVLTRLSQPQASPFVFPSPVDYTQPRKEIKTAWLSALREANLTDFRFHDLRHTMATRLAEATNNAFVVQRVLGHTNIQTSLIYVNMQAEFLREGMNAMHERWTEQATL
jgi:integrase